MPASPWADPHPGRWPHVSAQGPSPTLSVPRTVHHPHHPTKCPLVFSCELLRLFRGPCLQVRQAGGTPTLTTWDPNLNMSFYHLGLSKPTLGNIISLGLSTGWATGRRAQPDISSSLALALSRLLARCAREKWARSSCSVRMCLGICSRERQGERDRGKDGEGERQ